MPNNEIGFRSGNGCEQEKVPAGAGRFCLEALRIKLSRMFLLHLKEIRRLSVKMADVSALRVIFS